MNGKVIFFLPGSFRGSFFCDSLSSSTVACSPMIRILRPKFLPFFRQLKFFGRARINIARFYPDELKLVHTFPLLFTLAVCSIPFWFLIFKPFFYLGLIGLGTYIVLLFIDALQKTKSIEVAFLGIGAAFVQLFGYGIGFMEEGWKRLFEKKSHRETGATIEYPS